MIREMLLSLLPWGTAAVLAVQSWSHPALDLFFVGLSFLGTQGFYFLLLPVLLWCLDKRLGLRVALLVLCSVYLNEALKAVFQSPRPDPHIVRWVISADGWGFPSGHAQTTTALFGFLALWLRAHRWAAALWVVPPAVSLSRVYLGVHHPQDVVGGTLVGLAVLLVFIWITDAAPARWWERLGVWWQVAVLVSLTVSLSALAPSRHAITVMGGLSGIGIGVLWDRQRVVFVPQAGVDDQIRRLAVGAVALLAIYGLGKVMLPEDPALRFLRYAVLGGTATGLLPWLFVRWGWGQTAREEVFTSERSMAHA